MKTHAKTKGPAGGNRARAAMLRLGRVLTLLAASGVLTSCAGISELGAGATYDHRTGALGGQVTIKLAPPSGLQK
jgi:hypothetical protein